LEKWPAAIFRTSAALLPAKSVVFAGGAAGPTQVRQALIAVLVNWKNGLRPFFGHQLRYRRQKAWFLPAAQHGQRKSDKRLLQRWSIGKWPAAIFRTSAALPPAKSVVFAGGAAGPPQSGRLLWPPGGPVSRPGTMVASLAGTV
jgi:hypothetical protein